MERKSFDNKGVTLSYLDQGGDGIPIVALHAYWMEAGTYTALAEALAPDYRVIALDQRGHGQSDKPFPLTWELFIADLSAFLQHLGLTRNTILVGNSVGGTVAFRYAARNPGAVKAMVIEESTAVADGDLNFMRDWAGVYPSKKALLEKIGERLAWSVEPSFRETPQGWTLAFSPTRLADAQLGLNGDFWSDWCASECPVLLVRGSESRAVDGKILEEMAQKRPNTLLRTFKAGHVVHHDAPVAFAETVRQFLDTMDAKADRIDQPVA